MLEGQERFLQFFLSFTKEGKEEEAKSLLMQSFADQATKKMTMDEFNDLQAKLLPLIKPEKLDEVKQAMAHFSSNL